MKQQRGPSYPLRMPRDLKAWIAEQAEANERSLNSEIVSRLKESRAQEEQKAKQK